MLPGAVQERGPAGGQERAKDHRVAPLDHKELAPAGKGDVRSGQAPHRLLGKRIETIGKGQRALIVAGGGAWGYVNRDTVMPKLQSLTQMAREFDETAERPERLRPSQRRSAGAARAWNSRFRSNLSSAWRTALSARAVAELTSSRC